MSKILKTQKGYALVLVIVLAAALTILGSALLSLSLSETKFSINQSNQLQARYISQAGLDTVAKYVINDPTKAVNGTQISSNSFISGGSFVTTITGDNGSTIKLKSVGTVGTNTATLYLEMTPTSNSSDIFDNVVYSPQNLDVHAGTINGPLQSSGTITVNNQSTNSYIGSDGITYPVKENTAMTLPPFIIPTVPVGIISNNVINQDGQYDTISIGSNDTLTFTPPVNGILRIVANSIDCEGNINITNNGGKVYLFVKDTVTMQTPHSNSSINLVIFLGNYDANGNYILDGNGFSGEFQTKGNGSFDGYIYGPKSRISNNSHSTINGSIICDTFSLSNFNVNYVPLNSNFDFSSILNSGYKKSLYSNRWLRKDNRCGEMRIPYKNKGMTLIEVIVALAILGIISVSFLTLFSKGYTDIFKSGSRTNTTMKIQSMADYLNSKINNSTDDIDTNINNYLSNQYSYAKDVNYKKVTDIISLNTVESKISLKYFIGSLGSVSSTTPNIQEYPVTILWFINNSQSYVQITIFIIKGGA